MDRDIDRWMDEWHGGPDSPRRNPCAGCERSGDECRGCENDPCGGRDCDECEIGGCDHGEEVA